MIQIEKKDVILVTDTLNKILNIRY